MTVPAAAAAATARPSEVDRNLFIGTGQLSPDASESETGLEVDPGALVALGDGERECVGPLEVRQPQSTAARGVPGVGGFARKKDPAGIGQTKDSEVGG
jgi:hypothetical protein